MEQKEKVNQFAGNTIKDLILFCMDEKIENPSIVIEATITDGEKYRLIFERIDTSHKDPLFEEVKNFIRKRKTISSSVLKMEFMIGGNRAGRIMDQLEDNKIIGPFEGSNERRVLVL